MVLVFVNYNNPGSLYSCLCAFLCLMLWLYAAHQSQLENTFCVVPHDV